MARKPYPVFDDHMSRYEIADELEKLIFTAARDWQYRITIDRNVRDLIVRALRRE